MTARMRISALISRDTKSRLKRFVKGREVSQAFVVEQALLHHLAALAEIPPEAFVPPRVVLTKASAAEVLDRIAARPAPTRAMRELLRRD